MSREEKYLLDACGTCLRKAVKQGETVLAAVSGGVDSMVMLQLLLKLQEPLGIRIEVGHVHHHLRDASDEEWDFVEAYCLAQGVPFHGRHVDVRGVQTERGDSMEAVAHRLRHIALHEMMVECNATWLCLAHHADDRAETVLMNLLRGTSVKGLAAMAARNGVILRPLLTVTRAEIEAYAAANGLLWMNDESNRDTTIFRNRLRHILMPLLCEYNPHIVRAINHLAESSESASEYIDSQAEQLVSEAVAFRARGFFMLKREVVVTAHEAVVSALLRRLVEGMHAERHSLHFEMMRQALARIEAGSGRYDLGQGLIIDVTHRWIYIGTVPQGEWRHVSDGYVHDFLEASVVLSEEAPLAVRTPQPGDSICLANLGHKRLKKLFQEEGIPTCLRAVWPLIYDIKTKEVIWAPFLARATLLMYYNSVTFSEVDLTITIAGQSERLTVEERK